MSAAARALAPVPAPAPARKAAAVKPTHESVAMTYASQDAVDARWELCGRDAYVSGALGFPPR